MFKPFSKKNGCRTNSFISRRYEQWIHWKQFSSKDKVISRFFLLLDRECWHSLKINFKFSVVRWTFFYLEIKPNSIMTRFSGENNPSFFFSFFIVFFSSFLCFIFKSHARKNKRHCKRRRTSKAQWKNKTIRSNQQTTSLRREQKPSITITSRTKTNVSIE